MKSSSLQELEQIPGVGKTIAQDMQNIGIHSIDALKGRQAEQLYDRLCEFKAAPVDRCMLYVFNWLYTKYYRLSTYHRPRLSVILSTAKNLSKQKPALPASNGYILNTIDYRLIWPCPSSWSLALPNVRSAER